MTVVNKLPQMRGLLGGGLLVGLGGGGTSEQAADLFFVFASFHLFRPVVRLLHTMLNLYCSLNETDASGHRPEFAEATFRNQARLLVLF